MMPRKSPPIFLVLLVCTGSSPALAGSDVHAAPTFALGSTAVADPQANATLTANPAAMALEKRYALEGRAQLGDGLEYGASAVDATPDLLAAGAMFRRRVADEPFTEEDLPGWIRSGTTPTNLKRFTDVTVGVGVPFAERRFTTGLNVSVTRWNLERGGRGWSVDADLGVAGEITDGLTAGLVLHDLIPVIDRPGTSMGLTLGGRYAYEWLAVVAEGDWQLEEVGDAVPLSVGGGIELRPAAARVRAGARYDGPTDTSSLRFGLGAENDAGSLDYAVGIPLSGSIGLGDLLHVVSLTVRM